MAKLPMHRDLAGFDFSASSADARLVKDLSSLEFTDIAQNVVFIGGPGTGKTHLATALAVSGITTHNKSDPRAFRQLVPTPPDHTPDRKRVGEGKKGSGA